MRTPRIPLSKTWWGEQWLKALEELGRFWPNRLPRGRRYARSGAVVDLSLRPALVEARVQGTRPTPYRVKIRLRPFQDQEKEALFQALESKPFITAALLRLEMPPQILAVLAAKGLELIPRDPEEFWTSCSCPDWANPCKHIAAVFYTLTQAIDSDPFTLFLLRGVSREEILSRLQLLQREEEVTLEEFHPRKGDLERFYAFRKDEPLPPLHIPEGAPDFIFSLLTKAPVFYPRGDLRRELSRLYQEVSQFSLEDFAHPLDRPWERDAEALYFPEEKKLFLTHSQPTGYRARVLRWEGEWRWRRPSGYPLSPAEALPWLLELSLEEDLSPSLKTYVYLSHLAWGLVIKGHFIPQVKRQGPYYLLRFRPYYLFSQVRELMEAVAQSAPLSSFLQEKNGAYLPPQRVFRDFLEELVDFLLRQGVSRAKVPGFFSLKKYRPEDPVEKAFWEGLSSWLAPLEAAEKGNRGELSFLLEEKRKYWYLSLLLRNKPLSQGFSELPLEERKGLLETLGILSRAFPVLKGLESRKGLAERVKLSSEDLLTILGSGKSLLKALDVPVVVRGKLKLIEGLKLKAYARGKATTSSGVLSLDQLLHFDLKVALGDQELSFEELQEILQGDSPLFRLKDEFYLLSPEEFSRLKKLLTQEPVLTGPQALRTTLAEEVEFGREYFPLEPPPEVREFFEQLRERIKDLYPPPTVKARLRPYQLKGFRWLVGTLLAGFGACLADDMGLGKTLQTICLIAYLLEERKIKRTLIVAPTTLLGNWQAEFARFAPEIETALYHGPGRRRVEAPVLITSYGTLRSDQEELEQAGFDLVVLDEAQNIKNPEAAQTRAVYRLASAPYRVALSGTPIENRLLELWSLFRFLNPGLLGSRQRFLELWARPIEFWGDQKARERLRRVIAPFILRREKRDPAIAPELPEKMEKDEWCFLTPPQAALYQKVVEEIFKKIERSEGLERRGLVLKLLLLLKQICDHPSLYFKHRTGKVEDSGKLLRLVELLEEIRNQGEKVLIFSQFRTMGELICQVVSERFGETPFFLHGGVSRKKREELVQRFERGEGPFVFVLSLKAGGTGLNLVSATQVVHYDLWWNPAVESQATDRAYRIGQTRNVLVHRLLTRHTLEEKINALLSRKKELAESIVSAGEKWITELSNEELRELVALEN
ncbi:MAG: hypothetical protein DSZ24_03280 [Thermodesulfatator sp.]|nr:MAG: hypothetical protein DSZ24_03280 [Thermodesulfatator sp.]